MVASPSGLPSLPGPITHPKAGHPSPLGIAVSRTGWAGRPPIRRSLPALLTQGRGPASGSLLHLGVLTSGPCHWICRGTLGRPGVVLLPPNCVASGRGPTSLRGSSGAMEPPALGAGAVRRMSLRRPCYPAWSAWVCLCAPSPPATVHLAYSFRSPTTKWHVGSRRAGAGPRVCCCVPSTSAETGTQWVLHTNLWNRWMCFPLA